MRTETKQLTEDCMQFGEACMAAGQSLMDTRPEQIEPLTDQEMGDLSTTMQQCRRLMADCMNIIGGTPQPA